MTDLDSKLLPDARYIPFPNFLDWPRAALEPATRKLSEDLEKAKSSNGKFFREAVQFSLRAAAFDTGALEALYSTDRGLTFSVAAQAIAWQAKVKALDANALQFFEAQLQAYELVLDAVTGQTPISEAWVRSLHEQICQSQSTYIVHTDQGPQSHELMRGQYKTEPNHVIEVDGKVFAFAPVTDTPREMHRLLEELRGTAFHEANGIEQAAYAHYSFVRIHPFADGNGRVARALASLFLYRELSVPLVILADQRDEYLAALKSADHGQAALFSDFIQRRSAETLELVLDQVGVPLLPTAEESIAALSFGGGTSDPGSVTVRALAIPEESFSAAERLVQLAYRALLKGYERLSLPAVISGGSQLLPPRNSGSADGAESTYAMDEARILIRLSNLFPPGLEASVQERLILNLEESSTMIGLAGFSWEESAFKISAEKVSSEQRAFMELKLGAWADRLLRRALHELNKKVRRQLAELST